MWVILLTLLAIKFLYPDVPIMDPIPDILIDTGIPQTQQVVESFGPMLPLPQDVGAPQIESFGPTLPPPQDVGTPQIESFGPMLPQS